MSFIKDELSSIHGKSERELILKAIRNFDWENETIPEVYNRLFVNFFGSENFSKMANTTEF